MKEHARLALLTPLQKLNDKLKQEIKDKFTSKNSVAQEILRNRIIRTVKKWKNNVPSNNFLNPNCKSLRMLPVNDRFPKIFIDQDNTKQDLTDFE